MSNNALVRSLKENAPGAFEELVSQFARRLYSVSFRILRNAEDAEDAVQETFLNAFRAIGTFREEASLYTWLYRIACNQSLERIKRQGQKKVVPIEPHLPSYEYGQHVDPVSDWSKRPDHELQLQELSDYYEQCIDELPEDYRVAYVLKDVEKLSEDEVCQILGVTKFTMKNRVHRARLVIRKRIEERFALQRKRR